MGRRKTRARHATARRKPPQASTAPITAPSSPSALSRRWILLPALLLLVLVVYQPAWRGEMLWDDDRHMTSVELRSGEGLRRIWTELGATQQYYPIVHSAFWLQHRLWGNDTLGYHIVNISLHAVSAFLLFVILRRLKIPGAPLAAVIFAVHPVHVESVAWITELKNTLSGVFCLAAFLVYLRFDEHRGPRAYGLALGLFVLALLSKTVTATLPAALLVVFWWQRGTVDVRRDVKPLLPFFGLGIAGGLFTAWVERTVIGAEGAEFAFTAVERLLIAGRVIWFYLGKLFWPVDLTFTYPRWEVSQAVWWQYVFPVAALLLLGALWRFRDRSRAPLAALLLFGGTLVPVLGFFNVFPFRFSLVADHFQYLASIPIIALVAAALTRLASRRRAATALVALVAIIGTPLALLAGVQSRQYATAEGLYRATIARNPSSWMAHSNLGEILLADRVEESVTHSEAALRLKPDLPEARVNLGNAYNQMGRLDDALAEFEEARRLEPNLAVSHNNVCSALRQLGRFEESLASCEEALRLDPAYPEAHYNLGLALRELGRHDDAGGHLAEAGRLLPAYVGAHYADGLALLQQERFDEAVEALGVAVALEPRFAQAHSDLGVALSESGRREAAVVAFAEAVRLQPDLADASFNLANTLAALGRFTEAVVHYQAVLAADPDDATAHNNLGLTFELLGRLPEAATQFREVLRIDPDSTEARDHLNRVVRTPQAPV